MRRAVLRRAPIALACVALGIALARLPVATAQRSNPYAWFDPIIDVHRMVLDRYVTPPDAQELQHGAITGMLESLHDPYTEFIPTRDLAEFNKGLRGEYVGIGALVRFEDGYTTIVTALDDSPALRAGMLPGDRIAAVDGVSAQGMRTDEVIELLTGMPGSTVTITIERDGARSDVVVERRDIVQRTVAGVRRVGDGWDFMLDPSAGVGYLRLSQFNAGSPDEVRAALEQMAAAGALAVIFDVRFNPGGQLRAAVQIADLFMTSGTIVTTKGRAYPDQVASASPDAVAPELPVVVLQNRQSASASEVLAAALVDNGRGIALGTRSFGKGVTQGLFNLPSGAGQLKITEQHYYGPSGKMIHREEDSADWGVDPTPGFFVAMTDREYTRMLESRGAADVIRARGAADPELGVRAGEAPEAWVMRTSGDTQLAAALRAAQQRIETGAWQPVSDAQDTEAASRDAYAQAQRVRDRLLRELSRIDRAIVALDTAGASEGADAQTMLPDNAELVDGRVEVFDAEGRLVATLRITGEGLERWLMDAPVEKEE